MTESITPNLDLSEFYFQFNEILPPLELDGQIRPTANVFFAQLDDLLQPICAEITQEIYKKVPGKPGKYPFPVKAMLKAQLYAKFMRSMAYRALQREMHRNDDLRIAFGFKSVKKNICRLLLIRSSFLWRFFVSILLPRKLEGRIK